MPAFKGSDVAGDGPMSWSDKAVHDRSGKNRRQ